MKILSSLTQVVSNLYEFLFSDEHKRRYFKECQLMDPIDFHSFFFPTMEVNGVHPLSGYRQSSKILLLCSAWIKKFVRF